MRFGPKTLTEGNGRRKHQDTHRPRAACVGVAPAGWYECCHSPSDVYLIGNKNSHYQVFSLWS